MEILKKFRSKERIPPEIYSAEGGNRECFEDLRLHREGKPIPDWIISGLVEKDTDENNSDNSAS